MEENYKESLYEINCILDLMPKKLCNKIPNTFKEFVKENKSNKNLKKIVEPIEEKELKEETIVILGIMYRLWLKNNK